MKNAPNLSKERRPQVGASPTTGSRARARRPAKVTNFAGTENVIQVLKIAARTAIATAVSSVLEACVG